MIEGLLVHGLKMLVNEVAEDSVAKLAEKIANSMIYSIFGEKEQGTPNGEFLVLMDDSLRDLCNYLNGSDREFKTYFEYDSNAYSKIKLTALNCLTNEHLLKSVLKEMVGDESYELLRVQDIEQWIHIVDIRLPQKKYNVLYQYLMLHNDEKNQMDVGTVLKLVQALNTIKSEETVEDFLCKWFFEKCSSMGSCINKDVLEVGYIFADYLEKRKDYEKSVQITNELLKVYNHELGESVCDKEYIHKIIGCAYGLAIANVQPEEKKLRLLKNAETFFNKAYILCKNFERTMENQFEDICFLWGLFYSDCGALLVNKGNYFKSKGDISSANSCYKEAEKLHKESLRYKEKLKQALNGSGLYDENEIDNMIARSKSNIGGVYYRLEKYKESIAKQIEALETFETQGDRIREYHTKELIVGSYIALWKNDNIIVAKKDFEKCLGYMKTAKFYYEITGNKGLDGVIKKIRELEDIKVVGDD